MPKTIFIICALLNGGWMLFDGIHVLLKGKYFGPPEPGPWSKLVMKAGLDPFSLGPVFIGLGALWLLAAFTIAYGYGWAWWSALPIAILTLWYIPVGTLIALLSIAVLVYMKAAMGPG